MAERMYFIGKKTQLLKMREVTIENNSVAKNIVSSLLWGTNRIEILVALCFMGVVKKMTRRKKNLANFYNKDRPRCRRPVRKESFIRFNHS